MYLHSIAKIFAHFIPSTPQSFCLTNLLFLDNSTQTRTYREITMISFHCFLRTPFLFLSFFVWTNPIHWHLKLLARDLVLDVCFLSIQVIYIYVVPDEVIWTVNWLHYLNYEPLACTSITRNLVRNRNILGQTVSS